MEVVQECEGVTGSFRGRELTWNVPGNSMVFWSSGAREHGLCSLKPTSFSMLRNRANAGFPEPPNRITGTGLLV